MKIRGKDYTKKDFGVMFIVFVCFLLVSWIYPTLEYTKFETIKSKIVVGENIRAIADEINQSCLYEEDNISYLLCLASEIEYRAYTVFDYDDDIYNRVKSGEIGSFGVGLSQALFQRNSEEISISNKGVCLDQSIYACGLAKALDISCHIGYVVVNGLRHIYPILVFEEYGYYHPMRMSLGNWTTIVRMV